MTIHQHTNGPGLKVLRPNETWYGGGYCGVCGDRGDDLVPRAVRWWDCDDGWKMGVLCFGCGEDCAAEGPKDGDYALATQDTDELTNADRIDIGVEFGDLDDTYSQTSQGDG